MMCEGELKIKTDYVVAGNTGVLLARVVDADNGTIMQADVSTITVNLYELDDDVRINVGLDGIEIDASTYADEPDASDVVIDTLQTSRWREDSLGFNVIYPIVAPTIDKTYEIRVTITTTGGTTLVIARRLVAV
jgi:hypothetical protein